MRHLSRIVATLLLAAGAVPAWAQKAPPTEDPSLALPPEAIYSEQTIATGEKWRLVQASGYAYDDGGGYFSSRLYMIQGADGVRNAPLSPGLRLDLLRLVTEESSAFTLSQEIVDEIAASERSGQLSPALQAIAEPFDEDLPDLEDPLGFSPQGSSSLRLFGKCKDKVVNKTKSFDVRTPISRTFDIGDGFSGNIALSGNAQGTGHRRDPDPPEALRDLRRLHTVRRAVRPRARVRQRDRELRGHPQRHRDLRQPGPRRPRGPQGLGVADRQAAPLLLQLLHRPHPRDRRLQPSDHGRPGAERERDGVRHLQRRAERRRLLRLRLHPGRLQRLLVVQPTSAPAGLSHSRAACPDGSSPSVYAQVAVRGYLYGEGFAYAQVGVRPYLHGDLWGYYGNNCGDGNGDNLYETVDGLTFDLDWQVYVTAQADSVPDQGEEVEPLRHLRPPAHQVLGPRRLERARAAALGSGHGARECVAALPAQDAAVLALRGDRRLQARLG